MPVVFKLGPKYHWEYPKLFQGIRVFLRQSISISSFTVIWSIWKQVCGLMISFYISTHRNSSKLTNHSSTLRSPPSFKETTGEWNANLPREGENLESKTEHLGKKGESHPIPSRQYIHGKAWSILELEINSNMTVTGMSINTLILFEKWSQIFVCQKVSLIWLTGLTMMTSFAM